MRELNFSLTHTSTQFRVGGECTARGGERKGNGGEERRGMTLDVITPPQPPPIPNPPSLYYNNVLPFLPNLPLLLFNDTIIYNIPSTFLHPPRSLKSLSLFRTGNYLITSVMSYWLVFRMLIILTTFIYLFIYLFFFFCLIHTAGNISLNCIKIIFFFSLSLFCSTSYCFRYIFPSFPFFVVVMLGGF